MKTKEFFNLNLSTKERILINFFSFLICMTLLTLYNFKNQILEQNGVVIDKIESYNELMFNQQFGRQIILSEVQVNKIIFQLRNATEADWSVLIGIHNGSVVGPFHAKKKSILDESKKYANKSIHKEFQNIPLNIYNNVSSE